MMKKIFLFITIAFFVQSCDSGDGVKEYKIQRKKETIKHEHNHSSKKISQRKSFFVWNKPKHWIQKPASGMRLASFVVKEEEKLANCSVIILRGTGGGILPNINRWRGQMGLKPIKDISKVETIKMLGQNAQFVNLVGSFSGMGSQSEKQAQMLASVVITPKGALFVKLIGNKDIVSKEVENFKTFCQSFKENS